MYDGNVSVGDGQLSRKLTFRLKVCNGAGRTSAVQRYRVLTRAAFWQFNSIILIRSQLSLMSASKVICASLNSYSKPFGIWKPKAFSRMLAT